MRLERFGERLAFAGASFSASEFDDFALAIVELARECVPMSACVAMRDMAFAVQHGGKSGEKVLSNAVNRVVHANGAEQLRIHAGKRHARENYLDGKVASVGPD